MPPITIHTLVHAPLQTVWDAWTQPEHITKWCFASNDWEAPHAENDPRTGGKFKTRMQAKDQSMGFDFEGIYSNVEPLKLMEYSMEDGRHVVIEFKETAEGTEVIETFDPETENPEDMQRAGWQAILDNFKKHAESLVSHS